MADANPIQKGLLRFFLRILWAIGGKRDTEDGLPRVTGEMFAPMLAQLHAGDVVLLGNNGKLTHIGMHVGDGSFVHSMATGRTMRGWLGAIWDAITRPFRPPELTGVLEEPLTGFLDRYERDTWVVLRHPGLDDTSTARGVDRLRSLVGKPYDYDFSPDDDEYYCTELVDEFMRAALGEAAPTFKTTHHHVPLLLDQAVLEPVAVLQHPDLEVIGANSASAVHYAEWVPESRRIPVEK